MGFSVASTLTHNNVLCHALSFTIGKLFYLTFCHIRDKSSFFYDSGFSIEVAQMSSLEVAVFITGGLIIAFAVSLVVLALLGK